VQEYKYGMANGNESLFRYKTGQSHGFQLMFDFFWEKNVLFCDTVLDHKLK